MSECPKGAVPYVIRKGDTLIQIARLYNSSVDAITSANPGVDPDNLNIGQSICVPLSVELYPSCPTTNYYVVQKGDTFASIARNFSITFEQLQYANYGINPDKIYVDMILCIPFAPPVNRILINVMNNELSLIQNGNVTKTYPIQLQNVNYPIPKGEYTIVNKQLSTGLNYGARWLGLSRAGLGIHGTNMPGFIKKVAQPFDVVMSNRDIANLFNQVTVGTSVKII